MSMTIDSTFNYMNSFLVQESITLMLVALGLAIIGIGYTRIKGAEFLQLHRWVMRGAVILTLTSVFFVMLPSFYLYYINTDNIVFSGFSILQIIHSANGVIPLTLTVLYLFNDLPQPTKKWMKITAILWIINIALGAVIYYAMPS
jgi:uncharacterized membrane protein YozB (DUF420 family)